MALRHCVAAGEPLNPEVIPFGNRRPDSPIRDGYGQTETVLLCGNFPGIDVKPGSMGLPTPGFDLAVIDDAGKPLPSTRMATSPCASNPSGRWACSANIGRIPTPPRNAFRQGWYRTGDCGRVDAEGYFWFVGRADDVINSSAYRIGPFEVESALVEHPAVVEAAVVGKPDPIRGEIVMAFVVLAKGLHGHAKRSSANCKSTSNGRRLPTNIRADRIRRRTCPKRSAAKSAGSSSASVPAPREETEPMQIQMQAFGRKQGSLRKIIADDLLAHPHPVLYLQEFKSPERAPGWSKILGKNLPARSTSNGRPAPAC